MANFARTLGHNIDASIRRRNISPEMFAKKLGCSIQDVYNITEGKILIRPSLMDLIAKNLHTTKEDLLKCSETADIPELQYMGEFENSDNLDRILDLIDEYVELKND